MNGGWAKVRDYIVIGVIGAVGLAVWNMNGRMERIEATLDLIRSAFIIIPKGPS